MLRARVGATNAQYVCRSTDSRHGRPRFRGSRGRVQEELPRARRIGCGMRHLPRRGEGGRPVGWLPRPRVPLTLAGGHSGSRGLLDHDERVSTYWPEFAQNGKEDVTVRQLLSHQAGLSGLDKPIDRATIADRDALADVISRQEPAWEPGTRHSYHGISLGWYEGELIRRVDPKRRSIGRFFQEEIAEPLGAEFYIGVPAEVSESRIANIKAFHPLQMLLHLNTMPPGMVVALMNPRSLTSRSLNQIKDKGIRGPADLNKWEFWALEIPAGGGV